MAEQPTGGAVTHLSDLLSQHGGASVDDEHHLLRNHREVLRSEEVKEVTVQHLGRGGE